MSEMVACLSLDNLASAACDSPRLERRRLTSEASAVRRMDLGMIATFLSVKIFLKKFDLCFFFGIPFDVVTKPIFGRTLVLGQYEFGFVV